MSRPLRLYVDTSVFGGCLDSEFAEHSQRLFQLATDERLILVVSDVVFQELVPAPSDVRSIPGTIPGAYLERLELSDEVLELRDAYIESNVVSRRWLDDATHVAAATVARVDAIVSWNFRHIVRLDKIKAYNAVNLAKGYGILTILSPREVDHDEQDE